MSCFQIHVTTSVLLSTTLHLLNNAHLTHFPAKASRIAEMEILRYALLVDVRRWVSMQIPLRALGDSIYKLLQWSHFAVSWIRVQNSSKHYCSGLFYFYTNSLYYQALQS